jgi:hypothetical protein
LETLTGNWLRTNNCFEQQLCTAAACSWFFAISQMSNVTAYVKRYSLCQMLQPMSNVTTYVKRYNLCQMLQPMSNVTTYVKCYNLYQMLQPMSNVTTYVCRSL